MEAAAKASPSDDQPKPRLNWPTTVFASILLIAFAVLNLAGREDLSPEMNSRGAFGPFLLQFVPRVEHGWPLTFARREGESLYAVSLWHRTRWDVADNLSWFAPLRAAINVVFCLALTIVLTTALNLWRRRRCSVWQIHVRELLMLMTAAGVFFGLRTSDHLATRRDGELLATIDRQQGRPEGHASGVVHRARWERPEPSWWSLITGQRPERVVSVSVRGEPLESLRRLDKLKTIHHHGRLSPEELDLFTEWPELEALQLAFISAPRSEVRTMVEMPALPRLRALNLYGADFRGDGLEQLVSLEVLDVSQTYVDDAALAKIARLPKLRDLSLDQTKITGGGLMQLASLTQLESLSLHACDVDAAAVARLQEALPQCAIRTGLPLAKNGPAMAPPVLPAAASQLNKTNN